MPTEDSMQVDVTVLKMGSGVIRLVVALSLLIITCSAGAEYQLVTVDTSSPRATMESFLRLTEEAAHRYGEFRDSPSPATQDALRQISIKAERLFDLSKVAPSNRSKIADETFYLLWDTLARLELPEPEQIPDTAVEQAGDTNVDPLARWRIPNTEITIVRVEEGVYAGEYQFSQATVKNARHFYQMLREQPYVQPMGMENVYRMNELVSGWMIPMVWVEALPAWANYAVFDQVVWKWLAVILLVGIGFGAVIVVNRWARSKVRDSSFSSYLRYLSTPLALLIVLPLWHYFAQEQINVTGAGVELSHSILFVFYGITLVWVVWLSANQIAEAIIASPRIKIESLDASLLRLISRTIGVIAVMVLFIRMLNELGVPVYGLVTGAGVGGIAIALASKNTLENFMGALNLFADRPVRVGDLCRFDEESTQGWRPVGRVESIGLRSTKIRRIDDFLITIPNAEFAQRNIVNLSSNDRFLLSTTLGLRYETTDDQLRFLLVQLRELMHAHPKTMHTANDPIRIRFLGFGESCLNVELRGYIRTKSYSEFLAIQEDIMLRVLDMVKQAGTGFAFPSRTMYYARDGGLDDERQQAAEKQVREWASAQSLPFPDFTEDYRKGITDTLDYPPEGSPDADRG
ncbi:MAG: mechanosensitive ion channel family protein [Gammaproteobacteria bacterium]